MGDVKRGDTSDYFNVWYDNTNGNGSAERLEKAGVSVKVVNARFIKPMDEAYLHDLLGKNIPILTIEEACLIGGFGTGVVEFASENGYHSA